MCGRERTVETKHTCQNVLGRERVGSGIAKEKAQPSMF